MHLLHRLCLRPSSAATIVLVSLEGSHAPTVTARRAHSGSARRHARHQPSTVADHVHLDDPLVLVPTRWWNGVGIGQRWCRAKWPARCRTTETFRRSPGQHRGQGQAQGQNEKILAQIGSMFQGQAIVAPSATSPSVNLERPLVVQQSLCGGHRSGRDKISPSDDQPVPVRHAGSGADARALKGLWGACVRSPRQQPDRRPLSP